MTEDLKERTTDEEWLLAEGFDLGALASKTVLPIVVHAGQIANVDPTSYDRVVCCMSGGKDSLALLLLMLEMGVKPERIELHHNLVDGREGSTLMDWPVTESYCEAIAKAFGVQITFSWREGGLERELLRDGTATGPVYIPDGEGHRKIGGEGPPGIRLKFPQLSADLATRWCSSAGKIDVFSRYLNNDPKFTEGRTLVLTGERAEESSARAKYKVFEPHRCDLRQGRKVKRHIDIWRAVHAWSEQQVWDIIKRWRVTPHVSYLLGWSRASCRQCVFSGKDEWATIRQIAPAQFNQIAAYEQQFKVTIHRKETVVQRADQGVPFPVDPYWVEVANSRTFNHPVFMDPWVLPPGAFRKGCGPT